jgi:hypothetical protein
MANARCSRAAQLQARELLFAGVRSGPVAGGGVEAVGSSATLPLARATGRAEPTAHGK